MPTEGQLIVEGDSQELGLGSYRNGASVMCSVGTTFSPISLGLIVKVAMHHFVALAFIFRVRVHSPAAFKAGFSFSAQNSSGNPVNRMPKSSANSYYVISIEEPWSMSFMHISQRSGARTHPCGKP